MSVPEVHFFLEVSRMWADLRVTTLTLDPSSEKNYENEKCTFVLVLSGFVLASSVRSESDAW